MKKKEFIKKVYNNGFKGYSFEKLQELIEEEFPELVKKIEPFKNGDIVKLRGVSTEILLRITDCNDSRAYGFSYSENFEETSGWTFMSNPDIWQKESDVAWKDRLIEECKKRGIWDTKYFNPVQGYINIIPRSIVYNETSDTLWSIHGEVYRQGVFATPIETITKEEAKEQLGKKIF